MFSLKVVSTVIGAAVLAHLTGCTPILRPGIPEYNPEPQIHRDRCDEPLPEPQLDSVSARDRELVVLPRKCRISRATKTLIVVILDESGSMEVQKSDVIGGYNSFLESQKDIREDQGRVILIKFSTRVTVAHSALELMEAPKLSSMTYRPSGGTALYDAVAEGIRIAEGAVRPDERVLILIMTDGEENSSRKTTSSEVKRLIKEKENTGYWTFAYIGENPEGWAKTMGQSHYNVRRYDLHDQGANMAKASEAVSNFRVNAAPQSKAFFQ